MADDKSAKPVETAARGAMTPARMRRIWEREKGICWFCTKPVPERGPAVTYDHRRALELLGSDDDENIFPIHRDPCDKIKTAADKAKIAQAKRRSGETGRNRQKKAIPSRPFSPGKRTIPSRPFPKRPR